jgi:hypothetical protein
MKVQEFIFKNGLDALSEHFAIKAKSYPNGYVKLDYDQIDSPRFHEIADECRGIVLHVNPDNTSKVVTRTFRRFYNIGEGDQKFDFSNCSVLEKADGSMTTVSWSPMDNKWIVGTRGMAYAEGNFVFSVMASGGTFYDWIMKAFGVSDEKFQEVFNDCDKAVTFIFEYTAPENRVVTRYAEPMMVLLGVIENDTGKEEALLVWQQYFSDCGLNVRLPKVYSAKSAKEVIALAESLENLEEGFVVYDHNTGNRLKVKSSMYVKAHKLRGNNGVPSVTDMMELVLENEQAEFLSYFPELMPYVTPIENAVHELEAEVEKVWNEHKDLEEQKDFALAVKDLRCSAILFSHRKVGGDHPSRSFHNMKLSQRVKLLEKYVNQ